MALKKNQSLYRWIFHRSRGDSPFMKGIIHLTLIVACFIMIYPALRVLTISLRPGNRVLSTSLDIIPTDRLMIPAGKPEADVNILRERTPEEIQKKFNSQMGKKVERPVTLKFSGRTFTFSYPEKLSQVEIEKASYKTEEETQLELDREIAQGLEMVDAYVYIDTGYDREVISQQEISKADAEARPAKVELPSEADTPVFVPVEGNPAYDLALSQNMVDTRTRYLAEEVVQDAYGVYQLVKVAYVKVAPQLRSLRLPAVTAWADILPISEEQKITDRDNGLVGKEGKAVILVNGVNLVPSDYLIPHKLAAKAVERRVLYAKSGAVEFSYISASSSNYEAALFDTDFFVWIWNSLLITMSTAFMGVALASTSAYAFSRFAFPGRKTGLIFLLATQMIPAAMLILPIYILATNLGLIGNWTGLVVAYSVSSIPFSIHILKGYYDTIPKELEEAATIDGATKMQTFFRIMLPLAAPALAIVFLFNFMSAWNDFLLARIMLQQNPDRHTWPLGLQRLQGQFQTDWGKFSAAALMVSVPVTILFLASSKYLVSGLTLGSVKG